MRRIWTNIEEPVRGCDGWVRSEISGMAVPDQNLAPNCSRLTRPKATITVIVKMSTNIKLSHNEWNGNCNSKVSQSPQSVRYMAGFEYTYVSTIIELNSFKKSWEPQMSESMCIQCWEEESGLRRGAKGRVAPISMLMPSPLEPCPTQNIPPLFVLGKHPTTSSDELAQILLVSFSGLSWWAILGTAFEGMFFHQ